MFIILCISGINTAYAQKLIIRMNNGNETEEQLNSLQKLYFSNGQLIVDFKAGTDDSYSISEIRKLYFDPLVSVDETEVKEASLKVYPNPACDRILVHGIPQGDGVIRIFSIDGRLQMEIPVAGNDESIDISGFRSGLYLITATGLTSKFIKK